MNGRMLPPGEVAELYGLPVQTLAVWRHKGTGPAYHRLGKHVRYSAADVDAYLAASRVETDAAI